MPPKTRPHPSQLKTCSGSYLATWVCILRVTAVSTTVRSAPVFHPPPEISQLLSVLLKVTSKDVQSVAEIATTLVTEPNACFGWLLDVGRMYVLLSSNNIKKAPSRPRTICHLCPKHTNISIRPALGKIIFFVSSCFY